MEGEPLLCNLMYIHMYNQSYNSVMYSKNLLCDMMKGVLKYVTVLITYLVKAL